MPIIIERVRVVWEDDDDSGADAGTHPGDARYEAYLNGEWQFVGCYAEAELRNTRSDALHTIRTPGLWGIESDTDDAYRSWCEDEQLADLWAELAEFGVEQPDVVVVER